MTALYGVIGDPISQSLSPVIHRKWLREQRIDAAYEAFHIKDGVFDSGLETLKSRGARGLNVTLPHKHAALAIAQDASDAATKIGAANTLSLQKDGIWRADNTDAPGFLRALELAGQSDLSSNKVLLLGAGGSARAVAYALHTRGAKFTIANRTVSKAEDLSTQLTGGAASIAPLGEFHDLQHHFDIVINTTSQGYSGETLALDAGDGRLFFDISYGKVSRPQLEHAAAKGWQVQNGLGMLAAQAAYSFQIWFDIMPDIAPMVDHISQLVEATS